MNPTEGRNPSAKGEVSRHESRSNEDSDGYKRKSRRRG
jgi:hypothetical protein